MNERLISIKHFQSQSLVRATMNYDEAAEYLGIGKRKLTDLAVTGEIPSKKAGKARNSRRVFVPAELDKWLRGEC